MFNAPLFCWHVTFVRFRSEILRLHNFIERHRLRAICSCDFVVEISPLRGLDSEICACKLAESVTLRLCIKMAKVVSRS
jgi:hypothetical protein